MLCDGVTVCCVAMRCVAVRWLVEAVGIKSL